jgi:hypothetical protein
MSTISSFKQLSDTDLLVKARTLAAIERRATAQLIAALAELDARRLYLPQGCRSMFTYCTEILYLSEYAAYARIEAARAARRFPGILRLLEDGALTLTTVGLLATHLTEDTTSGCSRPPGASRNGRSKRWWPRSSRKGQCPRS